MKKCLSLILSVLLMLSCCTLALAEEEVVELYINMTVTMEDGVIYADLVDDQGGTVSTWPVSLEIDGVQVDTETTDEYGTASFYYTIPEDTQEIACVAKDGQFENYRFIGCTVYLEYTPSTDVTESEEEDMDPSEETDAPTEDDSAETTTVASQTTTKVVVATTTTEKKSNNTTPMTTAVSGDLVAIGVSVDNPLLIASGSTQSEFNSRARMWMDHNLYRSLVTSDSSTLHLQLTMNEQAGDMTRLIAAKNANPIYASYTDEDVKGFAMDLAIAYVDEYTSVPLDIEDGTYIVEIPVPATLRSCEKLAVAVCTSEGLAQLIEVNPSNGMLNFTIQRFQTLALVGFGNVSVSLDALSNTPWLLVLAIVLGVVLIAGGIVLLVFVAFRKKPVSVSKEDMAEAKEEPDQMVSFEMREEDDVFVAPTEPQEATSTSMPTIEESKVETPVSTTTTTVSTQTTSTDELDDLLDEVLSDLESI